MLVGAEGMRLPKRGWVLGFCLLLGWKQDEEWSVPRDAPSWAHAAFQDEHKPESPCLFLIPRHFQHVAQSRVAETKGEHQIHY